tara:strand:+ start:1213 stop:1491 length:279 start_codon:yes stop_codon:yes gene_type:complete
MSLYKTGMNGIEVADNVYRVEIRYDAGDVEVTCIGMNCVDAEANGLYDLREPLPKWLEEKLAILMLCDPTPPTEPVEGIGRRVDERTFWVQK